MVAPLTRPSSCRWIAIVVLVVMAWAAVFSVPALAVGWFLLAPIRGHGGIRSHTLPRPVRVTLPTVSGPRVSSPSRVTAPEAPGARSEVTYTLKSASGSTQTVQVHLDQGEISGIEVNGEKWGPAGR